MSVIEPETDTRELEENSSLQSIAKGGKQVLFAENADQEQQAPQEGLETKAAVKKRKSDKHKDRSHKKVKGVAYTSVAAAS